MKVKGLKQQRMKFRMKNLNGNQRGHRKEVKVEALEKLYDDKSSEKKMLRQLKQEMSKKLKRLKMLKHRTKFEAALCCPDLLLGHSYFKFPP